MKTMETMSYNWQSAATEQGRARLKTLVESLNGSECVIVAVSYEQGQRSIRQIFKGEEAFGKSFLQRFEEDKCPFKEFLDPKPTAPVVDENGLLPCPFCGGNDIDMYPIGNEWTKKRAYEIKCKTFGCVTTRKVGVITQSIDWAKDRCIERWNTRSGKPLTGRVIKE